MMVGRECDILGGVGGRTLVTVASASTLQTGLLQRCVIWRRGSGDGRPSEQLGEPCMRCVRTGVTDYGPGWKVSLVRCFSGPCPPLPPRLRRFLLFWLRTRLIGAVSWGRGRLSGRGSGVCGRRVRGSGSGLCRGSGMSRCRGRCVGRDRCGGSGSGRVRRGSGGRVGQW